MLNLQFATTYILQLLTLMKKLNNKTDEYKLKIYAKINDKK